MTTRALPLISKLLALFLLACTLQPTDVHAESIAKIEADARAALSDLYAKNAQARTLGKKAYGVLVFPGITKGGFIFAGQYGTGALISPHQSTRYYNSVAASAGLQAGVKKFAYAIFFMNKHSLRHLHGQGGWSIGSAPGVVFVDTGVADSLTTTELKDDIYVYFFNHKGLMAGIDLEGSKITRIHPK